MNLLSVSHLAKSYGGAPALVDASLDLRAGEVLALMGENGAGKSTLIKILAGAVRADTGQISLKGQQVTIANPKEAHERGFRFIHQELNIVPQLSVAENIFLGRPYPKRLGAFVDWRLLHSRARQALSVLDLKDIDTRKPMARLSTGDRMLVKVAATFLDQQDSGALIFVMDEPTAALTGEESERLFRIIAALQQKGHGIIYVSHRMDEIMRIADRITVLRDGETRATLDTSSTSRVEIIELMTGRTVSQAHPPRQSILDGSTAVSIAGLSANGLRDISVEIREGEILGIAGLAGAGQSHLLKALMGHALQGRVTLNGVAVHARQPADAWMHGIAYVPRERRAEGLLLSHDIIANTTLPHLDTLSRLRLFLNRRRERTTVSQATRRVRLKSAGLRQPVWQLSGGNQQKVVFARAIAGSPRLLLLDEPTRGVDVGAKFDIHTLLRELAASGTSIMLASSDLPELIGMTDRIAILRDGRVAAIVPSHGLTQQRLLALCYGDPREGVEHARRH